MTRRRPSHAIRPHSVWLASLPLLLLIVACAGAPASGPAGGPAGGATPASQPAERPAGGAPGAGEDARGALGEGNRDGALIVRTGRLRLEVTDLAAATDAATRLVSGLGGYVSASEEDNTGSRQVATITYRIPAERWGEALAALRGLAGRVIGEHTESAEVTAEVVDLEARIGNLRAAEAALQEIMNRAGTIDEVLKVQRELSNVRGEIEQLTARRDHLRQQAALGTLAVSFETPVVALTAAREGWDPGAEVDRAVAQLVLVGQGLVTLLIWLAVVALPLLLPVLLVALLARRLRRRWPAAGPPPDGLGRSV